MASVNYALLYPRFWLGYFVFSVGILALSVVVTAFAMPRSVNAADILTIAYSLVSLFPLYGFARQRRFNPKWLWVVVFAISVLLSVAVVGACVFMLLVAQSPLLIAIALLLSALGVPYLFAVHQYLFRSAHIWQ